MQGYDWDGIVRRQHWDTERRRIKASVSEDGERLGLDLIEGRLNRKAGPKKQVASVKLKQDQIDATSEYGTHKSDCTVWGRGQFTTDQLRLVSEKRRKCSLAAPPRGSSSSLRSISRGQPPGSGSSSSLGPTPPLSRGAERPLWAPHRTLQLPKPKRGALLSAGIWVVVKRLHCLVYELQSRLCPFHGGGSGSGSDGSGCSPEASPIAPPSSFLTVSATAAP